MKTNTRIIVSMFVMLITVLFIGGCAEQDVQTPQKEAPALKVGFIGPLTGDAAYVGIPIMQGVQLAVEELRTQGTTIEAFYEDGKCNGRDALTAYQKLTQIDGVTAVIVTCSPELLSIASAAEGDHVLVLSPSATAPSITTAGDHVFRLSPSDAQQGKIGAELMQQESYQKVGIFFVDHDYGVGLDAVVRSALRDTVVISERYSPGAADFRTSLLKIKDAGVEGLYLVAFPKEGSLILKQMKELGMSMPVVAAEAIKDDVILPVGEGITITVPSSQGESYEAFAAAYQRRFNEAPKLYSGEAYDTMNVVSLAAQKSTDLIEGMKQVATYNGVAGVVTFDRNGDVEKPYDMFTVKNGAFVKVSS